MQDIHSAERYSQFTQAVLDSAEREAAALITGAEKEKADMLRAAAHNVAEEEYQRLITKAERSCFQLKAQAAQDMRRELLSYRDGLCKKITEKVREKCEAFCKTDKYEAYITASLKAHEDFIKRGGITISTRECDTELLKRLCASYPGVAIVADGEISVGGIRIADKHKIYDETLDSGLLEEQERFLSYCGLKVV